MKPLFQVDQPVVYVITSGKATSENFDHFASQILSLVNAAVDENVALVQIREKGLSGKHLFDLASACAQVTKGTRTQLFVNDRADLAAAARADGVHLTAASIPAGVIRQTFGEALKIGVSAHSSQEADAACREGADFAVYGPVFASPGKGPAVGLGSLADTCMLVKPFPIIGLGGIDASNCRDVIDAGAVGVAGIRSFADPKSLRGLMKELNNG